MSNEKRLELVNKNQKNKVILDEYDKLKSSIPKWPWMTALKEGSGNSNPLTRKKTNRDKVRVVMTTTMQPKQAAETTVKPFKIISSADLEENMVPQTTITNGRHFPLTSKNIINS